MRRVDIAQKAQDEHVSLQLFVVWVIREASLMNTMQTLGTSQQMP